MKNNLHSKSGFTLIEILIYAALLVIIGGVASAYFIQISNVGETARRSRESLDNARRAMNVITQEIRHAEAVYTPTSVFDTNPGQLSLETNRDSPTDENTTYVDFYLDDSGIYLKRESQTEELITSEKVQVTDFTFVHLTGGSGNSVQVSLTVQYLDTFTGPATPVTLTQTASLRSY
jgi:type II secretory pathway component PulJ